MDTFLGVIGRSLGLRVQLLALLWVGVKPASRTYQVGGVTPGGLVVGVRAPVARSRFLSLTVVVVGI